MILAEDTPNEVWALIAFNKRHIRRMDKYVLPCTDKQELIERARIRLGQDQEMLAKYEGWTFAPLELTRGRAFVVPHGAAKDRRIA